MNKYCVYIHTNIINSKVYIGQTCQKPEYRWGSQGQGYKNSPHFYSAILKYGWNSFRHEIVKNHLTAEEANKLEQSLIRKYNSTNPKFGYNSDLGGDNKTPNDRTRELLSKSAMNKPIVSKETKEKLSKVSLGRKRTEETKDKIRIVSYERERLKNGKRNIPVVCDNTGLLFLTCRSAADWCGLVGTSGICSVCKHGKLKTAGVHPITKEKLKWHYATEDEIKVYEIQHNKV